MSVKPVEIVFGAIQFGQFPEIKGRTLPFTTVEQVRPMLDAFQAYGHTKVDTARIYGAGFSEKLLAEADWQSRGLRVETKLYPTKSRPLGPQNVPYSHAPEDLRAGLDASLTALRTNSIDTFYLYAPDRSVPYSDTLAEIDRLHRDGRFTRWGLCNFPAWEVALINETCAKNGYVPPAVYQGPYNALLRVVEPELLPCLRHYNMSFEAGHPIANGLLTSRYYRDMPDDTHPPGGRFDPSHHLGRHIRGKYWHPAYFDALEEIQRGASAHGLTVLECALRWLRYHSGLRGDYGDAICISASSLEQLEELLANLEKGPLPEEMVRVMEVAGVKSRVQPALYYN